ncbi:GH3 auxin-responsive promoter family protein [Lutibacter sp. TH_r2]|uniref:GH3 auxin-responsive promoter family protein n=1 Tax=Lutibacter sp. TH_r2 TaxID=3082083 RepID=UPI0029549067|nr:GH3 auxin-responsive promoter family protein [Lutibacter sp. TH_r2]MDV7186796.1 GH3 auxin-responsive promoter family protein [Lutibacter sp. TH_r2]
MNIKSVLAKPFAKSIANRIYKYSFNSVKTQKKVFKKLISEAGNTKFGKDHNFSQIKNYEDFKKQVPIRDYEALKPYVEEVVKGKPDILWKGKPTYFAKTSGTTSGTKYIPLTKESVPNHINAARNALLMYINETKKTDFLDGKMIFLQGSPELSDTNGIKTGRLSGISAHYVPSYLTKNRLPSWKTNCIEDWETKVEAVIDETINEDMTLIGGIPSWVQMYFERIVERTGKKVGEVFPNFNLFVYGGVNYEPYRNKFEELIGRKVDAIEFYPASEGFIAYQDKQAEKGMLLLVNNGMFYEFIPSEEFYNENPTRLSIKDVKLGENYVIILNTNAGLWAYNIGDTVEFVSLNPPRIVVTGRIKHFISAFGEHVIGKEVEEAINMNTKGTNISVSEFTVAPQITPEIGLPYHEWFVEFVNKPSNIDEFALKIDAELQKQNSYYFDLIEGKILQPLKITAIEKGGFNKYMKSVGKLGGQNKVPRLSNDRKIADNLSNFKEK